jgi:anti-sigma factor RsiW
MLDSKECPSDGEEAAEAYVMGRLPEEQALALEDHYAACETCTTILQKTAEYVDALRAAAKDLRSEPWSFLKIVGSTSDS